MATEVEQAKQVIDVFSEAYMQLVRERLRLQVSTFMPAPGKVQITLSLMDIKAANANGLQIFDTQVFTLSLDTTTLLEAKQGY
jgi:hypothetical protein